MSSQSVAIGVACALLIAATRLHAGPEPAGRIVSSAGAASAIRGDQRSPLPAGASVFAGDTLVTGADGRIQVRFTDTGQVALAPGSRFVIDSYHYSATPPAQGAGQPLGSAGGAAPASASAAVFRFIRGGFRAVTGLIGRDHPRAYKVNVPAATIGVRGTEFGGQLCEQSCAGQPAGMYVAVYRGSIELSNLAGAVKLEEGDFGFVADEREAPREAAAEGMGTLFKAEPLSPAAAPAAGASESAGGASAADDEEEEDEEDRDEDDEDDKEHLLEWICSNTSVCL